MMQAVAESGAAMSGASAVHINIFGLHPVVVLGTDEQKRRMLPPLIAGKDKACFAVTEPDAGLDTTALKVRAERRGDHYLLSGQKIWISTAQVANKILILARTTPLEQVKRRTEGLEPVLHRSRPQPGRGARDREDGPPRGRLRTRCSSTAWWCPPPTGSAAEGQGFRAILHGMNPERILIAAEAVGIGRAALAARRPLCARARGVPPPDRPEPGHRASAGAMLDGARGRQPHGDEGGRPLRPRHGMRRRGQCRQVSRRRGGVPRLRDRGDDPRRHGLFARSFTSSAICARS